MASSQWLNCSISHKNVIQTSITTPGQSEAGCNGKEWLLHIP